MSNVLFIGKNGENYPATEVDGVGFTPSGRRPEPTCSIPRPARDDNFLPRLYVVTGAGDNMGSGRRAIDLMTTADKCTFSDAKTAYCAVPDSMPEGAGMEPAVLAGIPDSVYKVNVMTGAVTLIGRPDTDTAISALNVSGDGKHALLHRRRNRQHQKDGAKITNNYNGQWTTIKLRIYSV